MNDRYILDGKTPRKEPDIAKWAMWFETADRKVAHDTVCQMQVSTVFLGLDHSFGRGEPLLFETMIFGGPGTIDGWQARSSSWDDAEKMHAQAVALARSALN